MRWTANGRRVTPDSVSGDVFVDTFVPFVLDAGGETAATPYASTVS